MSLKREVSFVKVINISIFKHQFFHHLTTLLTGAITALPLYFQRSYPQFSTFLLLFIPVPLLLILFKYNKDKSYPLIPLLFTWASFSIGYHFAGCLWIFDTIKTFELGTIASYGAFISYALLASVNLLIFCLWWRCFGIRNPTSFLLPFASGCIILAIELFIPKPLGESTWSIALAKLEISEIIVSCLGSAGLSFLQIFVAVVFFQIIISFRFLVSAHSAHLNLVLLLLTIYFVHLHNKNHNLNLSQDTNQSSTLHIALISLNSNFNQANFTNSILERKLRNRVFNRYIKETRELVTKNELNKNPLLDIIFWPEASLSAEMTPESESIIQKLADEINTPILLGAYNNRSNRANTNALFLITPADKDLTALLSVQERTQTYDKQMLVPLGETELFNLGESFLGTTGSSTTALEAKNRGQYLSFLTNDSRIINILPVICYESLFSSFVNPLKETNFDFITVMTNEAHFNSAIERDHFLTASKLRAIENGVPLVRISNRGTSSVISSQGSLINKNHSHLGLVKEIVKVSLNKSTPIYLIYHNKELKTFLLLLSFIFCFWFRRDRNACF